MDHFVVIGRGSIAKRHLNNLKITFPHCLTISIGSRGAESSPIELADICLNTIDELSNYDVRGAIVASPSPMHAKHAQQLMALAIPILIEKPVVSDITQFNELNSSASSYESDVGVGYCLRFLPALQFVKEMLELQTYGKVYSVYATVGQHLSLWRQDSDYQTGVTANKALGGGVLLELSHELDYLQWFFGELSVGYCRLQQSETLKTNVEEVADLMLHSSSGTAVHLHLDLLQTDTHRRCEIITEQARVEIDLIKNRVSIADASGCNVIFDEPLWDKNLMYVGMLEQFFNHTIGSITSIDEAGSTIKLIEQARELNRGDKI